MKWCVFLVLSSVSVLFVCLWLFGCVELQATVLGHTAVLLSRPRTDQAGGNGVEQTRALCIHTHGRSRKEVLRSMHALSRPGNCLWSDRKSTRLNSSPYFESRIPPSACKKHPQTKNITTP